MNWTESDLLELERRRGEVVPAAPIAKARIPVSPMNGLESDYAIYLGIMKHAGVIHDYAFEPFKLILAPSTTYTPDFLVIAADMTVECHETKGFMREDSAVKLKVAAEKFPWFKFVLVRKSSKERWKTEVIGR